MEIYNIAGMAKVISKFKEEEKFINDFNEKNRISIEALEQLTLWLTGRKGERWQKISDMLHMDTQNKYLFWDLHTLSNIIDSRIGNPEIIYTSEDPMQRIAERFEGELNVFIGKHRLNHIDIIHEVLKEYIIKIMNQNFSFTPDWEYLQNDIHIRIGE